MSRFEDKRARTLAASKELALTITPSALETRRSSLPQLPTVRSLVASLRTQCWGRPGSRNRRRSRCCCCSRCLRCSSCRGSCCRRSSCGGSCCRGCGTLVRHAVSPAGVKIDKPATGPAPDDHFAAGPHSRRNVSSSGRVGGAYGCPALRSRLVFAAGIQNIGGIPSTPDDHFITSPHRRVLKSAMGRIDGAGGRPTVRARIIAPASIQKKQVIPSTPDDHLAARPN